MLASKYILKKPTATFYLHVNITTVPVLQYQYYSTSVTVSVLQYQCYSISATVSYDETLVLVLQDHMVS